MSENNAISAPRVMPARTKRLAGSPEISVSSASGHLLREKSLDRPPLEGDGPAIRARIRQTIIADKSLSLCAQNVEISVGSRGVTLCGSVKSQEERKRIERGAAAVVKGSRVFNKLVVRPNTESLARREPDEESSAEQKCGRIRRLWGIRERSRL